MSKEQPVKPETKDPIKEAIDHPDGPGLEEMIYGEEDKETSYTTTQKEMNKSKNEDEKRVE